MLKPGIRPRRVVISGMLLSVIIELVQLGFSIGYLEVDDVIANTLGTIVGVLICFGKSKKAGI